MAAPATCYKRGSNGSESYPSLSPSSQPTSTPTRPTSRPTTPTSQSSS